MDEGVISARRLRAMAMGCALALSSCAVLGSTFTGATRPDLKLEQPDRTQFAQPPHPVKDFELLDQDGRPFKLDGLLGHANLVFFGFTNCPDVCPPTLQKLRQAQRSLQQDKLSVDVVFISVDGERDTPEAMKQYLKPFMPGFIGLTGDPKAVRDVATNFAAVFFKGLPADTRGGYNVEHTSQVYLVDRDGRLLVTFYNAPANDMIAVTSAVIRGR